MWIDLTAEGFCVSDFALAMWVHTGPGVVGLTVYAEENGNVG